MADVARPASGDGGLLRWRGLMASSPQGTRNAAIALLAIASCAMVATQTNYFVVGDAHLIAVLAPITACALLYGALPATVVGAFAGAAENIHATYLPLDVYETSFSSPISSVMLFALMGLVMGLMFAAASRRPYDAPWKGLLALVGACAIGSVLFTVLLSVSVNALVALASFRLPRQIVVDLVGNSEAPAQMLADFGLMALLAVIAAAAYRRMEGQGGQSTLRETFQGWLAVVLAAAYLVTSSLGYTAISAACRSNAESQMQGQVDYLLGQLAERDQLLASVQARASLSDDEVEGLHLASVGEVATGLPLGADGVTAVAEDGVIVSSSEATYVGLSFEDVVGDGLAGGFDDSLYSQTRSTLWHMGGGRLGYLRAAQVGYVRVSRSGSYQVMAAMPASDVFAWRPWLMAAISLAFVMVFGLVYAQASMLLKNVVVRNLEETNAALSRITGGDLDQEVSVSTPVEFARLSSGINETVGSLKDAIAAESARLERDLVTAKAIQESALPTTFPPFPEVSAFDIYACMEPAREVGGDFYDFFMVDDHTLGFLVADVSGKGIPAALFMMAAKTELSNYMTSGMPLDEAVQTANWHLCQGNDAGMFVTVWAATLDYESGQLTYVNAGHNPPLLRRGERWTWLRERGGLFLGTFDSAKYHSASVRLKAGDQLLLYTDGVNEAFSAEGEQYGDERLERFLSAHASLHPRALVDTLLAELRSWESDVEQSDDITMLSLEFGVPPQVTGSITVPATIDRLDDVLALVHGELARRLCPIATQHQLDVAIEELFVNVCNYAYEGQGQPGACRVDYVYNASPNAITVQMTDWGVPFDPISCDDPTRPSSIQEAKVGGLGIMMAKRLTDDISYVRDGDANVVAFRKGW